MGSAMTSRGPGPVTIDGLGSALACCRASRVSVNFCACFARGRTEPCAGSEQASELAPQRASSPARCRVDLSLPNLSLPKAPPASPSGPRSGPSESAGKIVQARSPNLCDPLTWSIRDHKPCRGDSGKEPTGKLPGWLRAVEGLAAVGDTRNPRRQAPSQSCPFRSSARLHIAEALKRRSATGARVRRTLPGTQGSIESRYSPTLPRRRAWPGYGDATSMQSYVQIGRAHV